MQVINDIISFLKTLSFVDIIFFFAVLSLMLLIITLIYFIKENSISDDNYFPGPTGKKEEEDTPKSEMANLMEIAYALENAEPNSDLNYYEEEQEEKAIISYEELLEKRNDFALNYSEEENIDDDLTIKKVDLSNLVNKEIVVKPEIKVSVMSYDKEEAFLEALKRLQQMIN